MYAEYAITGMERCYCVIIKYFNLLLTKKKTNLPYVRGFKNVNSCKTRIMDKVMHQTTNYVCRYIHTQLFLPTHQYRVVSCDKFNMQFLWKCNSMSVQNSKTWCWCCTKLILLTKNTSRTQFLFKFFIFVVGYVLIK